jgi:hypothetical protein
MLTQVGLGSMLLQMLGLEKAASQVRAADTDKGMFVMLHLAISTLLGG